MARIVPTDISRRALAGGQARELDTLALLKDRLPERLTIYHGVHWTYEYRSRTAFGEADFVVVDEAGRALLIEQKSGALRQTADDLVKDYADGPKSVVRQIHRAVERVREKFRWQHGRGLILDYLLYCPDHRVRTVNAAGLARSRIIDAGDDLCACIETLLEAAEPGNARHANDVHAFFTQTLDLVPDVHAHVDGQQRALARLTGPMLEVVDNLEMAPWHLRVAATAGSGKSLLAARFFDQQVAAGRSPLLVCFNRPLAELFRSSLHDGRISTFHALCIEFLETRGEAPDFSGMRDPGFWPSIQSRVIEAEIPPAWTFDALVVDEGQDFEAEWWDILGLFLRPEAPVLWLEDEHQNLGARAAFALPGFITWRSRKNYRSPESIARFARALLPIPIDPVNEYPGLGVGVHVYDEAAQQPEIVRRVLLERMRQGFEQEQIVIVSLRGAASSAFSALDRIGDVALRRFTGEYDGPVQVMTPGRLRFESIYRFKGQEAAAVILVDVDMPADASLARAETLLYCAITRATVRLDILARAGNPYTARMQRLA